MPAPSSSDLKMFAKPIENALLYAIMFVIQDLLYELFVEPNDKVIKSVPEYPIRMVFCFGPLGGQIEFYCERYIGIYFPV